MAFAVPTVPGMETVTRYKTVHRLLGSMALCGGGAAAVAWLSPGGLGRPGPLVVDGGASASVYRSVAGTAADAPGWAGSALEVAGEGSLVILGLTLVWLLWTAVRSRDTRTVAGSVVTGVATAAAYSVSEALKLVVDEERPCRAVPGAEPVAHCPELGDWSFPSNHATLAAGLAVGLAALRPRLALAVLPLAGAAALLRVAVGVHYPHDVLAGVVLAATVVGALLLLTWAAATRAVSPLFGRGMSGMSGMHGLSGLHGIREIREIRGNDPGLVSHHSSRRPVLDAQPGQDGADMGFDRPLHHVQSAGDLAVGQSAAEEGEHITLPYGQRVDPGTGGAAPAGDGTRAAGGEVRDHTRRDLR